MTRDNRKKYLRVSLLIAQHGNNHKRHAGFRRLDRASLPAMSDEAGEINQRGKISDESLSRGISG